MDDLVPVEALRLLDLFEPHESIFAAVSDAIGEHLMKLLPRMK